MKAEYEDEDQRVIDQIVKRHGEVINLRDDPQVIFDIIRRFGPVLHDDGGLPGGVPTPPGPGPHSRGFANEPGTPGDGGTGGGGPQSAGFGGPTLDDVMKQLLTLSRAVEDLSRSVTLKG